MKIKGTKTIMKNKDFKMCYFILRPILQAYFNGNMTNVEFMNELKQIYDIWFS